MKANLQIAKSVVARKNQDGSFILMKMDESSVFYRIEGLASEVWNGLTENKTKAEVLHQLTSKYPQFESALQTDIPHFFNELMSKNLVAEV